MEPTMKALVLVAGERGPELRYQDAPQRAPGPGQVRVALRAAALNRRDVWIRMGKYAGIRTPCILGSDGAGVVAEVGAGVAPGLVGQEVVIDPSQRWGADPGVQADDFRILGMPEDGTFAESIVVPAENVAPRPQHLSWTESAALPLGGVTSYRAMFKRGGLRPGERVLLPGIGSGVQTLGLLFAVKLGARVAVTSSKPDKLRRALELGAVAGFNHTEPDWDRRLGKEFGAPDLVVDGSGGDTFARCLGVVRPGGRVVSYGATAGPATFEVRRLFWKQLNVLGSTMGTAQDFREMVTVCGAWQVRPLVDQVAPLSEAHAVMDRMQHGEHMGKLVLQIA